MWRPEYIFLRRIMGSLNIGGGINNGGSIGDDGRDEVDASEEWQKGVYYFLCSCYALVSFVALMVALVFAAGTTDSDSIESPRVRMDHAEGFPPHELHREWPAALFSMYKCVFAIRPKAFEMLLFDFPGLPFFSTYTLLVLFWAEIYLQARSQPISKLRPTYYAINGIIYFAQFCIWLCTMAKPGHIAVEISRLFFSVVFSSVVLGFLIYGGRLFVMLRRFPIESRGRQNKLYEVGFVTATGCACFSIRFLVDLIASFNEKANVDVLEHPNLNLFYYMLVEIVPSSLVLFVLRKLPPGHVSNQYHPIR